MNTKLSFIVKVLFSFFVMTSNLCFSASIGQEGSLGLKQKLNDDLEKIRVENDVPAMAVGIIEHGKIYYQKGFGTTSTGQEVTNKTKFRVASITKLLTAQAAMQLVEKGKLKLDDNVNKYLSEFAEQNISIQELMTHHSGLKDKVKPENVNKQRSINQYLQESIDRQGELDKSFKYADLNFNVLGAVIAKVSGKSYPSHISERIIRPLKLTNTGFFQLGSSFKPDVEPYINGLFLRKASKRPFDPSYAPSEGLVTNVKELLVWLNATLSQNNSLLQTQTFQEMLIPRKSTDWGKTKMGLGWQVYSNKNGRVIQHAGSFQGVKALLIAYPDIKRGIIIFSNADELPRWDIASHINQVLASKTEEK